MEEADSESANLDSTKCNLQDISNPEFIKQLEIQLEAVSKMIWHYMFTLPNLIQV